MTRSVVLKPLLLATLCRQLAAARRKRPELLQVLRILADDGSWPSRARLRIQHPDPASDQAMLCDVPSEQLPFAPSALALMLAAERSGVLAATLEALADDYASQATTRQALRAAMFWPVTALMFLALMLIVASLYIMPAFQKFYADAGVNAPLSARTLGTLVNWTIQIWWFWVPIIAVVLFMNLTQRWPRRLQSRAAALCFVIPFVQRYLTHRHLVRLARWLEVLVAGSALRSEVFNYLHDTQLVPRLQRSTRLAGQALDADQPLSVAVAGPSFHGRLSSFLKIGELTDDVSSSLQLYLVVAIADERESISRFERGVLLVAYLIVGSLVAVFVSGIYSSISNLARTL